ncbi:MAG: DinB family protein [Candidatus Zixiibacteriota bacterium]
MEESVAIKLAVQQYYGGASWVSKKIDELTEKELLFRPNGDRNHIYWLFGHIVAASDIACYLTGEKRIIGPRYGKYFNIGSKPQDTAEGYPSIKEMRETFDKSIESAIKAIKSLKDDELFEPPATPLPEPLHEYFKTRGDVIVFFAHHLAYHSGQIATVLKLLGK